MIKQFLFRYQIDTSMGDNDFLFDCVHLFYCKCHKINFKRGGSYINSPDCFKKKKKKE